MGNAYKVGKYRLTTMQNATYNYLKENKGLMSVDQIVNGLYADCIAGRTPDIWTHGEKVAKVTKWCKALVNLKLINTDGARFNCA